MKYSGRINRRAPAGFTRASRNRGIDADPFFFASRAFFAIPGAFLFWKEVMVTNSASRLAFFIPNAVLGLVLCSGGVFLASAGWSKASPKSLPRRRRVCQIADLQNLRPKALMRVPNSPTKSLRHLKARGDTMYLPMADDDPPNQRARTAGQ